MKPLVGRALFICISLVFPSIVHGYWNYRADAGIFGSEHLLRSPYGAFEYNLRQLREAEELLNEPFAEQWWCWQPQRSSLAREVAAFEGDVEEYVRYRKAIYSLGRSWKESGTEPFHKFQFERTVGAIPSEFPKPPRSMGMGLKLYFEGAIAFRQEDTETARNAWEKSFGMVGGEYEDRSGAVWSAWMLGKTASNEMDALSWFLKAREQADLGAADPLGLALAADGWIEGAAWERGDVHEAIRIEFHSVLRGRSRALTSLGRRLGRLDHDVAFADPLTRKLRTCWELTNRYWRQGEMSLAPSPRAEGGSEISWLNQYWKHRDELSPGDAALAARLAYKIGEGGVAQVFLARAEPSFDGYWIRSKLALARGKVKDAQFWLELAANEYPREVSPTLWDNSDTRLVSPESDWWGMDFTHQIRRSQFWSDLTQVRIADQDYLGALDAALKQEPRHDLVPYIFQVLLDEDQAMALAKAEPLVPPVWSSDISARALFRPPHVTLRTDTSSLREQMGRRLVHAGRFAEAEEFLDERRREWLRFYAGLITMGRDENLDRATRADSLWLAAQFRIQYEDLFFIRAKVPLLRLAPDLWEELEWAYNTDGYYAYPSFWGRLNGASEGLFHEDGTPLASVATVSEDERNRQRQKTPDRTWARPSRFGGAELAWEAAQLMPDDHEQTAMRLWRAGSWIKYLSPKEANKFYRALVLRNPSVPLAQEAAEMRWFPASSSRLWDQDFTELTKAMEKAGLLLEE